MRLALAFVLTLFASTAAAQPIPERAPDGREWQELAVRTTLEPDIHVVLFRGDGGRLRWLMIPPAPELGHVVVEYADRPRQIVDGRELWRTGGVVPVDRRARIRQIEIYSRRPHLEIPIAFGA